MKEVKIYTTDYCPYCKKAKAMLGMKKVSYKEIDITDNEGEMRSKLIEMTGGQRTVPQIFVGDKHVGGSTDLEALIKSGEFDKLLED